MLDTAATINKELKPATKVDLDPAHYEVTCPRCKGVYKATKIVDQGTCLDIHGYCPTVMGRENEPCGRILAKATHPLFAAQQPANLAGVTQQQLAGLLALASRAVAAGV